MTKALKARIAEIDSKISTLEITLAAELVYEESIKKKTLLFSKGYKAQIKHLLLSKASIIAKANAKKRKNPLQEEHELLQRVIILTENKIRLLKSSLISNAYTLSAASKHPQPEKALVFRTASDILEEQKKIQKEIQKNKSLLKRQHHALAAFLERNKNAKKNFV
jgi:hypothetical protein